jgi:hypothetical protein
MKVEVEKFGDDRSLKVLGRFEKVSNFWVDSPEWVPRIDEVELLCDALFTVNDSNKIKKAIKEGQRNG